MITYICRNKDIKTGEDLPCTNTVCKTSICPSCGQRADAGSQLYWCKSCKTPIYEEVCPICNKKGKKLATDLRPVFPEERLLLELILGTPYAFLEKSVWNGSGNHYYVDGKRIPFSVKDLKQLNIDKVREEYQKYQGKNTDRYFKEQMEIFLQANRERYEALVEEADEYIRRVAADYNFMEMFVSFSGGKDSTVVSDLVMRALGNPKVLHIFGDTTLEFPFTYEYVKRFKQEHPQTPVITACNKEKDFEELCRMIGPPSRVMRWCCTVFKTGSIQKTIKSLFRNKKEILTFYGIRRSESASRSKYDRDSDSPKITKQRIISPIIDWMDFDIWLYLLTTGIDFNRAYRLGYARVGCWCCPNNSGWSEFLSKIHMKEQSTHFREMLLEFAREIGKEDAEVYVDEGYWKARQGGNGVAYAQKSVIAFEPCATQENTYNYELQKPIETELYELFRPFGYLNYELGNERLGEVYILGKNGVPQLKLQGRIGTKKLKVTLLDQKITEDKIKCQITKYQMCMGFVEKCSTGQKNSYKNHIADSDKPYSAVGRIGCWDKSQKELSATYIKALMNLLGIIDYFSEGDPGFSLRDAEKIQNLNVKVTKREYLLQIPSEKIYGYVEVACQGLDRAALFLQMRCGIRKLGEIHYNLMWVILGTVFLDEAWFEDSEVLDYMEVWYWSAILSGEFKIEQNRAFIRNLQNVLSEIQNIKESDKKFTKALCNNVLTDKKFADRDIVLMKNPSVYPEEVIGNTICQFYLSETYSDILKPLPEKNDYQPQTLSALNNSVKLQKHHIMPIGSLSVKYKDANKTTESRRKDNSSPYNSPLNFLLISEKANGLIQNSTLKEYFEFCDQTALNNVDIKDHTFTDMSKQEIGYRIGDEALQIFLEKRYDDFKSRITSKCRNLLNCPDICCGEGGN